MVGTVPHVCGLLAEYPQFQKYLNMILSRSHIRIISHQILYILLITYATLYIYICRILYTYIFGLFQKTSLK